MKNKQVAVCQKSTVLRFSLFTATQHYVHDTKVQANKSNITKYFQL